MKAGKTLLITVFHPFITKNILNTKVFSVISSKKGLNIILLVPEPKLDFFKNLYEKQNVKVVGVPTSDFVKQRRAKIFHAWSWLLLDAHYLKYKAHEQLDLNKNLKGYLKFGAETFLRKVLSRLYVAKWLLRLFSIKAKNNPELVAIFDKFKPDYVFSTDVFDEGDLLVAAEAKKRKIRLIGMVRSWDNCYSKGYLRVLPDQLIANNFTIKDEASMIHGVNPDFIEVLGSPQNDLFINSVRTPRNEFFESMGLDPNKKLILFAPAGKILSDTDGELIEIFRDAIDSGKFVEPVQFLIRNHPNHPADIKATIGRKDMIVEDPGKTFKTNNPKDTELTLKDNEHMADELYYADVVIWVATTLGMDAMVFDKPQLAVNFDGYQKKSYFKSVRRYHDEDHMLKMLKLGGVSVARNPEQLIEGINKYLKDPTLDKEGREKVRRQQFYKLDGKAGERIGQFVASVID